MDKDQLKLELSYNIFFNKAKFIMLIISLDTLAIIDANDAACAFYGYKYEELLESSLFNLDIDLKENISELLHHKTDFMTRHKSSNGIRDVKVKADLITFEEKYFANLVIEDITNNKYMFNHIINHNRQLEIILDNLPFMAWFKNVQGRYTVANKHLEDFCGHTKEEIIGYTDYDIFPKTEAEKYINSDNEILSRKKNAYIEEVETNGKWLEEYKCPVFDNEGNIIGTTGFNRDITSRKMQDKALHEAEVKEKQLLKETIELKDNFITLITHEFKTPITIINAAIQTMELVCNNELSSKARKYINKVKQNSYRQLRLVENLLDITRLKAGRMKMNFNNIDIVAYTREISESVKVFASRKDIKITFRTTIDQKWVVIDEEKYERILLNLLSNAIKFTPPNKNIYVKLSIEGFFIKLQVRDRGIGIASDKQNLIFDKFEQINSSLSRQAEGTGIGLYLVKSFTEALGGTVSLVSKEDSGSVFTVLIPIAQEKTKLKQGIDKDNIQKVVSMELSDIL